MQRSGFSGVAVATFAIALSMGCGRKPEPSGTTNGATNNGSTNNDTLVVEPARSLELEALAGCGTDAHCAAGYFCFQNHCGNECAGDDGCPGSQVCSDRGRCLDGGEEDTPTTIVEAAPAVRVTAPPDTILRAGESDSSVMLVIGVEGNAPDDRVSYRIERTDGGGDSTRIHHEGIVNGQVSIELPLGPEGKSTLFGAEATANAALPITVHSTIGSFPVLVLPRPKLDGRWIGEVDLETFGGQGFAVSVTLIGDDPESMKVVLPINGSSIFEPRDDSDPNRDYEVVTWQKNVALNQYQAVFTHEYRFTGGVFAGLPDRQVERTMRFDFDIAAVAAGRVEGRFSDTWRGLYDTQTQAGTEQVGTISFIGSFALTRSGDRPSDFVPLADSATAPSPRTIGRNPLASCQSASFAVPDVTIDAFTYSCVGITSVTDFEDAAPAERAGCAIAFSADVLAGDTTDSQLALYFGAGPGGGAPSFEEFLDACGDDTNSACTPQPDAECGYDLAAYAANDITVAQLNNDAATAARLQTELLTQMSDSAHEAFLARQLGAFYSDMNLRREWLRNSAAPGVFLDTVEGKNLELLQAWKAKVLDVHQDVFQDFFQRDALTQLGRGVDGALANEKRVRLLGEAGVLWRGYGSSLTLAADRWATIVRSDTERQQHLEFLQDRALELYLTMGLLTDFNRTAGAGFEGASLSHGFSLLTRSIERLATPHSDAVFARDAEVVTATSLNPLSDNDSLLSERRGRALEEVEASRLSIEAILDDVTTEALTLQAFQTRLQTESREAANRIAALCGLPAGCTADTLLADPACATVDAGSCGLADTENPDIGAAFDPAKVSTSTAGRAVLSVLESYQTVGIEVAEADNQLAKLDIELTELTAFKEDIDRWDEMRRDLVSELDDNLEIRESIRDENVAEIARNLADRSQLRRKFVDEARADAEEWNKLEVSGIETDYRTQVVAGRVRLAGAAVAFGIRKLSESPRYAAMALPTVTGASTDTNSVARAKLLFAEQDLQERADAAEKVAGNAAGYLQSERGHQSDLESAKRRNLRDLQAVDQVAWQNDIANLEDALTLSNQIAENELEMLREAAQLARAQLEVELAYERDYAEFRRRNAEFQKNLVDTSALLLKIVRAEFRVRQRLAEYSGVVLEASLENAKLVELRRQLTDLNNLAGGVGAIFTKSYALERAEDQLTSARDALMEWLVVLEYYAVRPFIAQRVQILLSRNAYQLEEVANTLKTLERECGGSERSKATQTLSLRDDVLELRRSIVDATSKSDVDPDGRFRDMLEQSYVPVNRRVRYSTSATLAQTLDRNEGVLAASFTLGLDEFANLSLACNAKIESIAVQLVGALGDGRPTVTVIYDGVSRLRSCQPNIDEYVRAFGNGMSDYGSVSYLRTDGRAMSPLAGINSFIESDQGRNRTLAGLPVSSEYTLIIDTTSAANEAFDWSAIEDVIIQVEYSYQDLFPEACD